MSNLEDVVYCASSEVPLRIDWAKSCRVPGAFLDAPPLLSNHNPLPLPSSFRAIARALDQDEVEFVHVHNLRTAMSTAWLVISRLRRRGARFKVLLTDHNARWFPFPKLGAQCVDYYVPVSSASSQALNAVARRPSFLVPTGVPSDYPGLTRPSPAWDDREFDITFYGRIVPWKRPDLALRLAHSLEVRGARRLRVLIAGSNSDPEFTLWLRREAARLGLGDSLSFVLDPTDSEAAALLSRSRLFVLMSDTKDVFGRSYSSPELSPITVLEAAACGVPTICNDLPALREQVEHSITGLVIPVADWDRVVDQAGQLLSSRDQWAGMSLRARSHILRNRTYRTLANRLEMFFDQIREGLV